MRNRLLQLISNRLRIWRTIPAIAICGAQRIRIAPGERIFRLGDCAYKYCANHAGLARDCLCHRERSDNLIIFCPTGGENAGNEVTSAVDFDLRSGVNAKAGGKFFSDKEVLGVVSRPRPLHLPPGISSASPGGELVGTEF